MTTTIELKPKSRAGRKAARHTILAMANAGRPSHLTPFGMRHLDQAVFKCRQLGLVDSATLVPAGFRARRRSN